MMSYENYCLVTYLSLGRVTENTLKSFIRRPQLRDVPVSQKIITWGNKTINLKSLAKQG